jgi:hypothetical protein
VAVVIKDQLDVDRFKLDLGWFSLAARFQWTVP